MTTFHCTSISGHGALHVFGKAHGTHHKRGEEGLIEEATIHLDCCFLNEQSADMDEEESARSVTVLVMYDDHWDALWALVVNKKGATPEAVKWCCDRIENSGYNG